MMFTPAPNISVEIPRQALESIFQECDRYNVDETGGRILGTYSTARGGLDISVKGIIEPGPDAQRTQTYFKQDGAYQERVFREVESRMPSVEHLGNWHTHHVNGLRHLSGGDIETYRRTVDHAKHNTDFFYALLVTEKHRSGTGLQRYAFKNYVMRRGDPKVYEIPASSVRVVESPLIWPNAEADVRSKKREPRVAAASTGDLVVDQQVISEFFPKIKLLQSTELGIYWRGSIHLADGSEVEAVVLRDPEADFACSVTLRNAPGSLEQLAQALDGKTFVNGRTALISTERACNAQLLGGQGGKKRRRSLWTF